jgi:23S rRNA pseudouridine1911/1915/1917 synthase
LEVVVEGSEGSTRLDRVLATHLAELSRSRLKALILAGAVSLRDTEVRDPAYHVISGDTIRIDVPEAVPAEPKGEAIALDIVFEDDDIIVLNKPKGLVVTLDISGVTEIRTFDVKTLKPAGRLKFVSEP